MVKTRKKVIDTAKLLGLRPKSKPINKNKENVIKNVTTESRKVREEDISDKENSRRANKKNLPSVTISDPLRVRQKDNVVPRGTEPQTKTSHVSNLAQLRPGATSTPHLQRAISLTNNHEKSISVRFEEEIVLSDESDATDTELDIIPGMLKILLICAKKVFLMVNIIVNDAPSSLSNKFKNFPPH